MMEFLQEIMKHWQEIVAAGLVLFGAFVAFLGALYAFFLLVPGEQPDKTIKALLDFTKKYSRKPLSILLMAGMAMTLSACLTTATDNDCLRKSASAEIAVTEVYQSTIALLNAEIIDKKTAEKAKKSTDAADALVESGTRLCLVDKLQAENYLKEAASLLLEANTILSQ